MSSPNAPYGQDVTREQNIEFYVNLTEELSLPVRLLRAHIQELSPEIELANRRVSFYQNLLADLRFKHNADLQLMACRYHNKRLFYENKALRSQLNTSQQNSSNPPVPLFPNCPPPKSVAVVNVHTKSK